MSRVIIGNIFLQQPRWKVFIGVPLIYLPLVTTVSFAILGVLLVRMHLNICRRYKYKILLGLCTQMDFTPISIQQSDCLSYRIKMVQPESHPPVLVI
jgi:hypothetical protein